MNSEDSRFQTSFPTLSMKPQPPCGIGPVSLLIVTVLPRPKSPPASCIVRGAWTEAEDENLRQAVSRLGNKKWSDICRDVPSRTGKQCRERWFNQLAPGVNKGPFEVWEDRLIFEKQRELGNKWARIAALLPGRSVGSIKNRWYSGLRASSQIGADLIARTMVASMTDTDPGTTDL
jgi:hypothetical protein